MVIFLLIRLKFLILIFSPLIFFVFASSVSAADDCNYTIGGTVYEDVNKDGQFDRSPPQIRPFVDKGLDGWKITLYQNGKKIKKAVSSKTGYYVFTRLCKGTYTLAKARKPGWTMTEPSNYGRYTIKTARKYTKYVDFGNILIPTPTPTLTPTPTSAPIPISTPTPTIISTPTPTPVEEVIQSNSCGDENTNIALNKPITVSGATSYDNVNIITNGRRDPGIDGSTGLTGTNPSLTIDLGSLCAISKINLEMLFQVNRQRVYHNVTVKLSDDQKTWTTVFDSSKDGEFITSEQGKDISFSPKTARHVKVSSNGGTILNEDEKPNDNNWIEVSVYGASTLTAVPVPTPQPSSTPIPTPTPTPTPTFTPTPTPVPEFTWNDVPNLPAALSWPSAAVISDKIYVPIGHGKICSIFVYAPSENLWTYGPKVPWCDLTVTGATTAIDSKLFIISSGDLHIYDTETGSWTKGKSAPIPVESMGPVKSFALASANGKVYMIGGGVSGGNLLNKVYEYDPSSNAWSEKAAMPTPRQTPASSVIGNLIYVAGGQGANGLLSNLEVYDPSSNTWTVKSGMPTARTAANAVAVNGKLYVIGGSINNGFTNIVEEYDPLADKWTKKKGISIARTAAASVVVSGKVYVMGGVEADTGVISSVEEGYIPFVSTPTVTPAPAPVPQLIKDLKEFVMELLRRDDGSVVLYERGGYGIRNGVRGISDPENFLPIYGFSKDIIKQMPAEDQDSLLNLGYNFARSKGSKSVAEIKDVIMDYKINRNSGFDQMAEGNHAPNAVPVWPASSFSLYPAPGTTQSNCGTVVIGGTSYERIPIKFYGQRSGSQATILYLPGTNTPFDAWEISQEEFIRIAKLKYVDNYGGITLYDKLKEEDPSVLQPNACSDLVWKDNSPWRISSLEEGYRLANDPTQCNIGTSTAPLYLPCVSAGYQHYLQTQSTTFTPVPLSPEEIEQKIAEIRQVVDQIEILIRKDNSNNFQVKKSIIADSANPGIDVEVLDENNESFAIFRLNAFPTDSTLFSISDSLMNYGSLTDYYTAHGEYNIDPQKVTVVFVTVFYYVPGIGTGMDFVELFSGKSLATGEKLKWWERGLNFIPVVGELYKTPKTVYKLVRGGKAISTANKALTSLDDVASYIEQFNKLPDNFITKTEALRLGWISELGNLDKVAPGKSIGGDIFKNTGNPLPSSPGRTWYEADINYSSGLRGTDRIIYSNDGLIFKTTDHYQTFTQLR